MSYLEKHLEGIQIEWKALGEVIKLNKGKQLNKDKLSNNGLYLTIPGKLTTPFRGKLTRHLPGERVQREL